MLKKIVNWFDTYSLKFSVIFLLFFIPLYPKFPLIDLRHTWVYIRWDDFAIALVTFIFGIHLLRKKATLKTPLTLPIAFYWIAGFAVTLYSLIFVVGHIPHVVSNLVVLHYLRRIEYMVLFFIAFNSVRSKKDLVHYSIVLGVALFAIFVYSLGQRLAGFPAILTMNEEFAKGKLLYLPPTARITATFAGHYDLAAYMVLLLPIILSLMFAVRRWIFRILLVLVWFSSYLVLLFTESRVSIGSYLAASFASLWFIKRRLWIIPVLGLSLLMLNFLSGSSERFYKTFRIREVAFNLETGQPIAAIEEIEEETGTAIAESQEVTKEELPVGTGFIGLPSKVGTSGSGGGKEIESGIPEPKPKEKTRKVLTEVRKLQFKTYATQELAATGEAKIATVSGKFLIRKALVYDISFTTRFQGEWPRAVRAFKDNPLLGRGFSTVSLATDNDYIRMLGESGILGTSTFLLVFFAFGAYIYRGYKKAKDSLIKNFALGTAAGVIGLGLNAVLIDVFEASKVAYTLWLLIGLAVGALMPFYKKKFSLLKELKTFFTSVPFVIFLIYISAAVFFVPLMTNYFVGDDYTWLRWAAESGFEDIILFFISAKGFFYRPLQKILYLIMFNLFWLVPKGYHMVSLGVHIAAAAGVFMLSLRLMKKKWISIVSALVFLFLASNSESVFWISSLGNQLAVLFTVWTLYFYLSYRKTGRKILFVTAFIVSILAPFSYEGGIIVPILILLWEVLQRKRQLISAISFFLPTVGYLFLRNHSGAYGLAGDYSYNWAKIPLNFGGNLISYVLMFIGAPRLTSPWATNLRLLARQNIVMFIVFAVLLLIGSLSLSAVLVRKKKISKKLMFLLGYLILSLLPFLGLGNFSIRYSYLAAPAFALLFAMGAKKLLEFLLTYNRYAAVLLTTFVVALFTGYNGYRLRQAAGDWEKAGEIAEETAKTLRYEYFPIKKETNFYFANVPTRYGVAWVFPVGLQDALWHSFQDPRLKVYIVGTVGEAYKLSEGQKNVHIFFFRQGKVEEVQKETVEFEKEFEIIIEE